MKNTLDMINGRIDIAKEKISQFEDTTIETCKMRKKKKLKKNEQSMNELQRQFKHSDIHEIWALMAEERQKIIFEKIMIENIPSLSKT